MTTRGEIKQLLRGVGRLEAVVAVGVITTGVALSLRNLSLPMRHDETITVIRYAAKPFWEAWSTYSTPNNHVLHTLLVWVAYRLGDWNPIVLRLPAFLAACLTLPATWWFVRREHGWPAAAFATTLLATSPFFIKYATNARGYSLLLLCFVLALLCAQAIVRRPDVAAPWAVFAGVVGLGMLAIPLMAFPAAIAAAWMLLLHWRTRGAAAMPSFMLRTAAWSVVALAFTAVLYAPVLLASGSAALLDNAWVQSSDEGLRRYGTRLAAGAADALSKWRDAMPIWAHPALLATIAACAAARGRPTGRLGLFAAAVVVGTAAVLAVKPVVPAPRMLIFLLLAALIVVGVGAAAVCEALLAWMTPNARARSALSAVTVTAVLGGSSWWAARPETTEWISRNRTLSAMAARLVVGVEPDLRPGDYVAAPVPTIRSVAFYLGRIGRETTAVPSIGARIDAGMEVRQVDVRESNSGGRLFVFNDDEAPRAAATDGERASGRRAWTPGRVQRRLDARGCDYRVVVDLPDGKVFRLEDAGACLLTSPVVLHSPAARQGCSPFRHREASPIAHSTDGARPGARKNARTASRSSSIDSAELTAARSFEPPWSPFVYHEPSARSLLTTHRARPRAGRGG